MSRVTSMNASFSSFASRWRRRLTGLPRNRTNAGAVISVLAALLALLVAVIRTILHRWVPIGDNGLLLLRTADVGTSNHPLLGTWTSASLTAGTDFNNPGPLLFDVLAGPVKLFGYGIGMPIGLAVLNGASIIGAAFVAFRQAGSKAVIPMMVAAAGIAWAMGSELLIDPWQPHAMMLPFFALLALLWGIVCGDIVLVAWFAGVASLLVQTHLSYSFLVLFFTIGVTAAVVIHVRRSGNQRRVFVRTAISTGVVVIGLWSQPIIEQLFGDGDGNLGRLVANSSSESGKIGLKLGTRLVAEVLVLPGWFSRESFASAVPPTPYTGTDQRLIVGGVTSFPIAALAVVTFMIVTGLLLWHAIRLRQRVVVAALGMVQGLMLCALAAMVVMPSGILGLSPHQMRWLWPMSAFNLCAIVASTVVMLQIRFLSRPALGRWALGVGTATAVLFGALGSPTFAHQAGPTADRGARDSVRRMMDQMAVLRGIGPIVFDDSGLRFAEPYSGAVMARLGELDIPFEVENPGLVRQVGDGRKISGGAESRLYVREGYDALDIPPGVDRVAFVAGLSDIEQAERDESVEYWTGQLADGLISLSVEGTAALERGGLGLSQAQIDGLDDSRAVVELGLLSSAAERGWLEMSNTDVARLERLRDLQRRWQFHTVGLFLAPIQP